MMGYEFEKEFQLKCFWFNDCEPKRFYQSQWTETRWMFWMVKMLMLAYWIAAFFYSVTDPNRGRWWLFLTNWGVVTHLLYFISSFSLATYGMFWDKPSVQVHVTNVPTVSETAAEETKPTNNEANKELRWFHIIVWILQIVAFDIGIFITVAYWALLVTPSTIIDYGNINVHALNAVIIILDLFINNLPVRLLQFYLSAFYGALYTIFSLILHGAGYESAIYMVIDWANRSATSIGFAIVIIFVAVPIIHLVHFGLYHLRFFIARRTVLKDNAAAAGQLPTENQNPAFVGDV